MKKADQTASLYLFKMMNSLRNHIHFRLFHQPQTKNQGMNSGKTHGEIVQHAIVFGSHAAVQESNNNKNGSHSQTCSSYCFIASCAEYTFVQGAVFHTVEQVDVKADHHPYYQTNPCIQRQEYHHEQTGSN